MSMISTQCDELRNAADELQDIIDNGHNYTWSGFYSTLRYAQQVLRSAAVTIWELRSKLAGVVDQSDEIDKLNEQVRWLKKGDVLHVLTDQELADQQRREREMRASIKALEDENARLRELVRDMWTCIGEGEWDCSDCPRYDKCDEGVSEFVRRMRELGVEADG